MQSLNELSESWLNHIPGLGAPFDPLDTLVNALISRGYDPTTAASIANDLLDD